MENRKSVETGTNTETQKTMKWADLISKEKLVDDSFPIKHAEKYKVNEFEKDHQKIIYSADFRRLQDKTQVFPLDKNDFIRTRLTHSIEVSTIARQLGIMVCTGTTAGKELTKYKDKICAILQCAGLLHDIGNPPFGHFGEVVIQEWFQNNMDKVNFKIKKDEENMEGKEKWEEKSLQEWLGKDSIMVADLKHFEGNAQAFRILSKGLEASELNISSSIISTIIKYPADSKSFDRESPFKHLHKPGYYNAEKAAFDEIANKVGTKREKGVCRHPLTYLLEAADDIAYATSDLEDAFKKGMFTLNDFINFFQSEYDNTSNPNEKVQEILNDLRKYLDPTLKIDIGKKKSQSSDNSMAECTESEVFSRWLNEVRYWLMNCAIYRFNKSYDEIMNGTFTEDLFYETNHTETIRILKDATAKYVFNDPGILKLEIAAQEIITFLLERFVKAALYLDDEKKMTKADKKYMNILSKSCRNYYMRHKKEGKDIDEQRYNLYLRLLMVTDFISRMTDTYARTLYRELSGIE